MAARVLVIEAMKNAGMSHAWVRIHGEKAYSSASKKAISGFVDDLKTVGISVAGWGWCQGADAVADAKLALKELDYFKLTDYVADIEHGHHNANWTESEITNFCTRVRAGVSGGFGITTFPLIDWHEPKLMKAAIPFVDMFNPQVYWLHYPNKKMVKQFKRPNGKSYTVNNAAEYTELCLDGWTKLMGSMKMDFVLTGASYWGEGNTRADGEDKVDEFLSQWNRFNRVIGLNWWHFGGDKAMSYRMLDSITKAKLGAKTYTKSLKV